MVVQESGGGGFQPVPGIDGKAGIFPVVPGDSHSYDGNAGRGHPDAEDVGGELAIKVRKTDI